MVIGLLDNKEVKFSVFKSSNVPDHVLTDSKLLVQILNNLLSNAVKFTEKGKIRLCVHYIDNKLCFEVSDTGIGISQENQKLIFKRFKQLDNSKLKKYKGSGLGLNITKKIIELLKGEIKVSSKSGEGTLMKFYIPVELVNVSAKQITEPYHKTTNMFYKRLESPLVLIIDNNEQNQYYYSNYLAQEGYQTFSCFNSSDGLRVIRSLLPDCILLRMEMPRIHGQKILEEIEKMTDMNQVNVLAVTPFENYVSKEFKISVSILTGSVSRTRIIDQINKMDLKFQKMNAKDIVFVEKESYKKHFFMEKYKVYQNIDFQEAILQISRKNIERIIFDDMDLHGENFKLIKWLVDNPGFLPKKLVVVADNLFDSILKCLTKIPDFTLISYNETEKLSKILKTEKL
jgi:CheY-like chemotaxis protein/anti-sigma regulatory factor (Ser/Thr protein kinase)